MKIPEIQAEWELFANSDGKANVVKWVEALESGKYRQTKTMLHKMGGGFCCLGVQCDLVEPTWKSPPEGGKWFAEWLDGSTTGLPDEQVEALGLFTRDGNFNDAGNDLTQLNDNGATFKQIAKFIRDMWKHQFGEDLTG